MHTLSLFPSLFDFALLAPFFLRLSLAYIIGRQVWNEKPFNSAEGARALNAWQLTELLAAFFIAIGMFTQAGVILAAVLTTKRWRDAKKRGTLSQSDILLFVATLAMSASLLFLGAGFLAFDLPL